MLCRVQPLFRKHRIIPLANPLTYHLPLPASTIFDPLLSDIAKCASLALERSGLIKAPVDGDVETERSTRQTVTRTNYWKLELTTLNAYAQFLGADLADGEQVEGTIKAVEDRIVELEVRLGFGFAQG
jgi:hypothetical protein